MCPPSADGAVDRVVDLRVEVEAEVVARGEVDEPVPADPDPTSVDLVDDRIEEGMALCATVPARPGWARRPPRWSRREAGATAARVGPAKAGQRVRPGQWWTSGSVRGGSAPVGGRCGGPFL